MIPGLPEEASRLVTTIVYDDPRVVRAVIYGSRAKGTYRQGSDVDLCLDAPALDFSSLVNLENRIDDLYLPWRFDISVRQRITSQPLLDHIDRVGIALKHDKGN